MKEKWKKFRQKCAELSKKAGTRAVIAVCAVLILGGAAIARSILGGGGSVVKAPSRLAVDLASDPAAKEAKGGGAKSGPEDAEAGQSAALSSGETRDYFASISLERRQARDEAIEVLKTVTASDTATGDAKADAAAAIGKIAEGMESEANIESLVRSKGFEQCVAVVNGGKCSVIVESDGLLQSEVAQISEIVWEQAGIAPENLKIIEKGK